MPLVSIAASTFRVASTVSRIRDTSAGVSSRLAVAQLAQEGFGLVGDRFQNRKCQEAARSLDGVNGAENASQQICILRVFLEFDEILIQPGEVFVTLDQKLTNRFLVFRARCYP